MQHTYPRDISDSFRHKKSPAEAGLDRTPEDDVPGGIYWQGVYSSVDAPRDASGF